MRNPSRSFDKTHLSIDLAEERGLLHRDYLAHCLRWSHVVKFFNQGHTYKDAIVLDVGCGKEMPLAKLLYVNKMTPAKYVGVDMNKFDIPEMLQGKKIPISIWEETDFCELEPRDVGVPGCVYSGPRTERDDENFVLPNVFVSFEVLEHMAPSICRRFLQNALSVTSSDCHFFISTPCYNGSAAGNHINEMTFSALGALFEDLGFHIENVNGTFASISDYASELSAVTVFDKSSKKTSTTDLRPVFDALRNYYDTNVLSVIFAPLFPAESRNCLWHLTKKKGDAANQERLFSALETAPGPWSQHDSWRDLAG